MSSCEISGGDENNSSARSMRAVPTAPVRVRLPSGVARNDVEDAEGGRTHADREPGSEIGLLLHERHAVVEERLDIGLLARLGSHTDAVTLGASVAP
jgi:hypothetical protein